MKESNLVVIAVSFFLGVVVGVTQYYLVDGYQNSKAREATRINQNQVQSQLSVLQSMCPEVLQKAQAAQEPAKR